MDVKTRDANNRNVVDLFGDVVDQTTTLFRQEVRLAKAEIGEKISRAGGAASRVGVGAVFLIAALVILLEAAVEWLAFIDVPHRWGALGVGLVVAIIGAILLRKGMNDVSVSGLTPHRTAEQLQRDVAVARGETR